MKRATIFLTLLLPISLLLGLGFVINGRIQAKPQAVDVGGSIATDTTWTAANSPYIITETVTVDAGVTLTVEAGVTVMTSSDMGQYLDVKGHLEAVGTAVNPILFTAFNDLSANRWSGVAVSGSANFEYVTMRYAYTALFMSESSGGDLLLENTVFEENSVYPIIVNTDALHRLKMNNVTFNNNVPNRVGIETAGGNLTLMGSPTLGAQPGLEGYEERNMSPAVFSVPDGVTLTLEAGTNLMMLSTVQVAGHVAASGTITEPVLWQTVPGGSGSVFSVIVMLTGTAVISHTVIKGSPVFGIAVVGESDEPVIIENSTLQDMGDFPMIIEPPSLHRVQMNNVTFLNNAINQVLIDTSSGIDAIAQDAVLTAQPGLDYYHVADAQTFPIAPATFVVPNGVTLTVGSGVEMRFGQDAETFVVNGRLQAIGTPTQPITFTSANDLTPGEWVGLQVNGGLAELSYAQLRFGVNNLLVGGSGTADLDNTTLREAAFAGLTVDDGAVTAVCSSFIDNTTDGIVIENSGTPSLFASSSNFSGNGSNGLNNLSGVMVDARNNWWGDASGPSGIGLGSGQSIQGNVLFSPWFTEETCTTMPYRLYLPSIVTP
jgi:hypothetical protein